MPSDASEKSIPTSISSTSPGSCPCASGQKEELWLDPDEELDLPMQLAHVVRPVQVLSVVACIEVLKRNALKFSES